MRYAYKHVLAAQAMRVPRHVAAQSLAGGTVVAPAPPLFPVHQMQ